MYIRVCIIYIRVSASHSSSCVSLCVCRCEREHARGPALLLDALKSFGDDSWDNAGSRCDLVELHSGVRVSGRVVLARRLRQRGLSSSNLIPLTPIFPHTTRYPTLEVAYIGAHIRTQAVCVSMIERREDLRRRLCHRWCPSCVFFE